jgi:hypothetical protein
MDVRARVRIWRDFVVPGTDKEYYTLDGPVAVAKTPSSPGETITDRVGLIHRIRPTTEAYTVGLILHFCVGDMQLVSAVAGAGQSRMLGEFLEHAFITGETVWIMVEELSQDSAGLQYDKRHLYACCPAAIPDFGLDMLGGPEIPDTLDVAYTVKEEYTFRDFDNVANRLAPMYPGGNLALAFAGGDGTAIVAGQTLTGAVLHGTKYPTARVVAITIATGSFAGHDAAGHFELRGINGDFLDTEIVNASGGGHAHASGYLYVLAAYQRPARPS